MAYSGNKNECADVPRDEPNKKGGHRDGEGFQVLAAILHLIRRCKRLPGDQAATWHILKTFYVVYIYIYSIYCICICKIINILATQLANVLNLIRAQQKFQEGGEPFAPVLAFYVTHLGL